MDKRKKKLAEKKKKRENQKTSRQQQIASIIRKVQNIPEDQLVPIIERLHLHCDLANVGLELRKPTRDGERGGQTPWQFTAEILAEFTAWHFAQADARNSEELDMPEISRRREEERQRDQAGEAQVPGPHIDVEDLQRRRAQILQERPDRLTRDVSGTLAALEQEGLTNDLELYWFVQLNYRPIWERTYPDTYEEEGYAQSHADEDEHVKQKARRILGEKGPTRPPSKRVDTVRNVNQTVGEHGWMVQAVYDEGPTDGWCYTVGLKHSFDHPELIIFGLPMESAHFLLNDLATRIKNGQRFQTGDRLSGVANADLAVISVPREQYEEGYFAIAQGFYGNYDFDSLQVIWPDKKGLFPWEAGYDTHFNETQTVLGPATEETRAVRLERST